MYIRYMDRNTAPNTNPATSKESSMNYFGAGTQDAETTINTDETLSQADRDLFTARAAKMTAEELDDALTAIDLYSTDDETARVRSIVGIYENERTAKTEPKRYTEAELRDVYCVETAFEEFDRETGMMSAADLYDF